MKASLSTVTAVAFLSTSSLASAGETLTPVQRIEKGVIGAVESAAGFSLHGTVLHAGAPWAVSGLESLGLGMAASTVLVATAGSTAVGLGVYEVTRAIVGNDPRSPLKEGLPGFVSGGLLTAIGGEGIVQIGLAMAAGTAGLGVALAATSIIAAVGLGFLAYGAYRAYQAHQAAVARLSPGVAPLAASTGGTQVPRTASTQTTSSPASAPGSSGVGVTR